MIIETETMRWNEFVRIAQKFAPGLIPDLQDARDGGMQVQRYKSGQKVGALYISMSERSGADYGRWGKFNCGPGLAMYKLVQAVSKANWDSTGGAQRTQMQLPPNH
jgi:hypothetical protein